MAHSCVSRSAVSGNELLGGFFQFALSAQTHGGHRAAKVEVCHFLFAWAAKLNQSHCAHRHQAGRSEQNAQCT
jgi:hypothetical protein